METKLALKVVLWTVFVSSLFIAGIFIGRWQVAEGVICLVSTFFSFKYIIKDITYFVLGD